MFTVLACIRHEHDLRLVVLAALICVVSSTTAFRFHARSLRAVGAFRWAWIALTGVVAGSGVWATHFIAMVAYEPHMPIQYEFWGTAASLLPAVVGMGVAFAIPAWLRSLRGAWLAGAVAGLSIALMHYLGIAAIRVAMRVVWNEGFVIGSIVTAVVGGMAAFTVAARARGVWHWIGPPALLVLAICGLHFTAMAAVSLVPLQTAHGLHELMSRAALGTMAGGVATLILLSAICLIVMEAQTGRIGLQRLQIAFEAVPAGLALYDNAQRLVLWNRAYQDLGASLGIEPRVGSVRHARVMAAAASGQLDGIADADAWATQIETVRGSQAEVKLKDGRWLSMEGRPLQDGGLIVAFTDVSALKNAAETMAAARDRAEAANRSKTEFLANMSHEIRTPLNGVVAAAAMLARADLGAREHEMVEIVRSSASSLDRLLSDILDLARIESGETAMEVAPFHLGDLVRSVVAPSRLRALEKGVSLETNIPSDLEGPVLGDSSRVRQILANLLSNAVKFTEQGRISLAVARGPMGLVRFEVADTGIGFDIAEKERVLSRFQQGDGSITRRFGGSGLGLTISRDLSRLMGGNLDCESAPGVGSKFWFEIPLEPAFDLAKTPAPDAVEIDPERNLRILLADDHPINRKVVELILAGTGAELTSVENGEEALRAFTSGRFDLVLMDMQMPVMDGLSAVKWIRAWETGRNAPRVAIIMLTANAMPDHVEASRAAGADYHLGKPITPELLFAAIDHVLADEDAKDHPVAA